MGNPSFNYNLIIYIVVGILVLFAAIYLLLKFFNKNKNTFNEPSEQNLNNFSALLKDLSDRIATINDNLSKRIDDVSNKMNEQIHSNFKENMDFNEKKQEEFNRQQSETKTLIKDITEKLKDVEATNNTVKDTQDELKQLHKVLTMPKQRGNFGERQLGNILNQVFSPTQFKEQYSFKDGKIVDAIVYLKDNLIVPIDSKFSLENYNRLLDEDNKENKIMLAKTLKNDIKSRIDETSLYIKTTENTTDFAFMFIPSESLYYDLLINKIAEGKIDERDLIEYAFSKKVIIVSPTTLVAYLTTVSMGLKNLVIEENAKNIREQVLKLESHLTKFEESYRSMGNTLGTVVNKYNETSKLTNRVSKVSSKITSSENEVDIPLLERPQQYDEVE